MDRKEGGKELLLGIVTEAVDMLSLDWDELTNFIDPDQPLNSKDTIKGEMTDGQKVLYTALTQISEKLREAEDGTPEVGRLKAMQEILKNVLYFHVNTHFGVYDSGATGTGIRQGFRVVTFDPEFPSFAAMMLGRM